MYFFLEFKKQFVFFPNNYAVDNLTELKRTKLATSAAVLPLVVGKAQIREWILIDLQPDQLLIEQASVKNSVLDQILTALPNVSLSTAIIDERITNKNKYKH